MSILRRLSGDVASAGEDDLDVDAGITTCVQLCLSTPTAGKAVAAPENRLNVHAWGIRVGLELARRNRSVTMTPEQFIAKLIALVPPPGVHMTRYADIFADRHHLRRRIAPPVVDAPVVATQLPLFDLQGRVAGGWLVLQGAAIGAGLKWAFEWRRAK